MDKVIDIKGIRIGGGVPVVCVPIVATTASEILSEIKRLSNEHVQMIEWRVDYFDKIERLGEVEQALLELSKFTQECILLATYRSKEEGGQGELAPDKRDDLLLFLAKNKAVDFVDVELMQRDYPDTFVKKIQECGARVIASCHHFHGAPSQKQMLLELQTLSQCGADIAKLAVMPSTFEDTCNLLFVTKLFSDDPNHTLVITMAMGKMGVLSRLCGEITGSVVTFASGTQASAPGQVEREKLTVLLEQLHQCIEE